MSDEVEFVRWILENREPMSPEQVEEAIGGFGVTIQEPKKSSTRFSAGDRVTIVAEKHTIEEGREVYIEHDGLVGEVVFVSVENNSAIVQFEGKRDAEFAGALLPRGVGIYKYVEPNSGEAEIFEMVYRAGSPPTERQAEEVQKYLDGADSEDGRSSMYYSGAIGAAYRKKEGAEWYFQIFSRERDRLVAVSPFRGSLFYLGRVGHRPEVWTDNHFPDDFVE